MPEIIEQTRLEGLKSDLKKEARRVKLNFGELKSGGFIKQVQKDLFTVRLRCPGGRVTSDRMRVAAEIAEKYGRGELHMSARQSVEVPYVSYEHFDDLTELLRTVDWSVASCGPRVRVPTACGGCTYNPNGLMDTQSICAEVDRRYFSAPTGHHKFKIAFCGCPIDCFRTRENDLGFQGVVEPKLIEDQCSGCELCVRSCEDDALKMVDGLPVRDDEKCNGCGDCIKVCPVDAMAPGRRGWLARVGGKHGKHPIFAYEVANFVSDEQVYSVIEATLPWYEANGQGRERLGITLGRLGVQKYIDEVIKPLGLQAIERPEDRRKYKAEGNFYE